MIHNKKVCIALSGGVDSCVAAALLIEQGYNCLGVHMITHDDGKHESLEAKRIADKLGLSLEILDLRGEFEKVIEYFCTEYSLARTPNPCVFCNREIKFGYLWDYAKSKDCDFFATGHYIRSLDIDGDKCLYRASDLSKDQSYVLSMIDKEVISHILLPLGKLKKQQIRQIAAELELGIEDKADSQEICFIPDNDYIARLEQERPELVKEGNIVFTDGRVLGKHSGLHRFTIGQRRGLGVAVGSPIYVVKLDLETNTVILGEKKDLMTSSLIADGMNWLCTKPKEAFDAIVKVRYNHSGAKAMVIPEGERVTIRFNEEISAITPGQVAAIYKEDANGTRLLGGGWILSSGEDR